MHEHNTFRVDAELWFNVIEKNIKADPNPVKHVLVTSPHWHNIPHMLTIVFDSPEERSLFLLKYT